MTAKASSRWLITFPGPQGCHGTQECVVVEHRGALGPGGHRLYTDVGGTVRVEITDSGAAHLLTGGTLPVPDTPVHAQPLPTAPRQRLLARLPRPAGPAADPVSGRAGAGRAPGHG
ncbi:DUF6296 family protein [Kitasatospora sp. NPDC088346]|uniref:DUF6296 family protein n=1 Tax=Kitasatospora sp. NPDC088346 TaxID=3364073 RepID=UPI0038276264